MQLFKSALPNARLKSENSVNVFLRDYVNVEILLIFSKKKKIVIKGRTKLVLLTVCSLQNDGRV